MPPESHSPIDGLLNLGPKSTQWLAAMGITTEAALRRIGAVPVYVKLKRAQRGVSLNLLYALAGALEGVHWTEIRRTRRLELLLAVEDQERSQSRRNPGSANDLLALRNIGPAMRRDLASLGISSAAQLARRDPDTLFVALERKTGQRQDPCVWDTFAAAIHQARTGEARPWWHYTPARKRRQATGSFPATVSKRRR